MIDATHLKAHRTAASLLKKWDVPRAIGRTKGGLKSKLHAVVNGEGKPIFLHLSAGQVSDYKVTEVLIDKLPKVKEMLADRGYDADWFKDAFIKMAINPCIPPKKRRKVQHPYDKTLYKKRHKIENMVGWLKDWRRISTRYDRCSHTFKACITIAVIVIFWL